MINTKPKKKLEHPLTKFFKVFRNVFKYDDVSTILWLPLQILTYIRKMTKLTIIYAKIVTKKKQNF